MEIELIQNVSRWRSSREPLTKKRTGPLNLFIKSLINAFFFDKHNASAELYIQLSPSGHSWYCSQIFHFLTGLS